GLAQLLNRIPHVHQHEIAGLDALVLQHEEADRALDSLDLALGPEAVNGPYLHRDRETHGPILRACAWHCLRTSTYSLRPQTARLLRGWFQKARQSPQS